MFKSYSKLIFLVVSVLVVGTLVLVSQKWSNSNSIKTILILLPQQTLTAEILDTPTLHQKGLSGRQNLATNQAVLMIFPTTSHYGIWMPNMNFPIDVIWLDDNQKIVHLVSNMKPESYPQTFKPSSPAKYIIETNIGVIENNQLKIGQSINFKTD